MSLNSLLESSSQDLPYVEADLNYLMPMAEKPVNYTYKPPLGIPQYNGTIKPHTLRIHNARTIAPNLSLDRETFALVEHSSRVRNFYDEAEVHRVYYPEAEQFVAAATGAARVLVFDHNIRSAKPMKSGNGAKEPVKRVHNDFTAKSGYSRAEAVLSSISQDQHNLLLNHRLTIINVWRPILGPVQESPLAMCDAQSIAPSDLIASDLVYRDRIGETYSVTHNPAHRWFYVPQMQQHEVLLIKCFDSAVDGRARFAAHTAFDDPTSPKDAPPRQSIELRTLAFYPA